MEETSLIPNRNRLISELIGGRDCTKKLQNLLHQRVVDGDPELSPEDLIRKIIGSFSESLSTFNPWCTGEFFPAPATSAYVGSASSSGKREKKPQAASKEPRGCYKRRKTDDLKKVKIAKTYEDGYAWRKYGQKEIQHAKFPRCYYRCTYKDQGCRALKHVHELEDGSALFRITYFGSHTCQNVNKNTQMFSDSGDRSLFLINFEDSRIEHSPSSLSAITNTQVTSSFNQENDSKAQSGDRYFACSHDTSSMRVWKDMLANLELSNDDIFKDEA